MNEVGVLSYYTFVTKGYMENQFNYTPVSRVAQEEVEEKVAGHIPERYQDAILELPEQPEAMAENVQSVLSEAELPFLASENVMLEAVRAGAEAD